MRAPVAAAELAMVWQLFRHDASRQRKRIALTVLAIAWGTLSIVLLLSFGIGSAVVFLFVEPVTERAAFRRSS